MLLTVTLERRGGESQECSRYVRLGEKSHWPALVSFIEIFDVGHWPIGLKNQGIR